MRISFVKTVKAKDDKTILDIAYDNNIKIKSPCNGKGKCGKCLVKAKGNVSHITKAEKKLVSEKKLEKGYRLACETKVTGDCEVCW